MFPFLAFSGKLDQSLVIKFNNFKNDIPCKTEITSGHRSKIHNKKVGGSSGSYHLKGKALDIIFYGCKVSLKDLGKIAKKYFNGVIVYPKHIHVDIRSKTYHSKGKY